MLCQHVVPNVLQSPRVCNAVKKLVAGLAEQPAGQPAKWHADEACRRQGSRRSSRCFEVPRQHMGIKQPKTDSSGHQQVSVHLLVLGLLQVACLVARPAVLSVSRKGAGSAATQARRQQALETPGQQPLAGSISGSFSGSTSESTSGSKTAGSASKIATALKSWPTRAMRRRQSFIRSKSRPRSRQPECRGDLLDLAVAAVNSGNLNEQSQPMLLRYLHDMFNEVKDWFLHRGSAAILQHLRGNATRGRGRSARPIATAEFNVPLPSSATLQSRYKQITAVPTALAFEPTPSLQALTSAGCCCPQRHSGQTHHRCVCVCVCVCVVRVCVFWGKGVGGY